MVERILERARRLGAEAEVFTAETAVSEITFDAGNLKTAERKRRSGVGLRVVSEGRVGFSSSSDAGRFDEMAVKAVESARFGKEALFSFAGGAGDAGAPRGGTFDPAVESYPPEEAVREGSLAVERLRDECPDGLTDVSLASSVTSIRVANTAGLDVRWRSTEFRHSVTTVIVEGDSILWIADGGSYGTLDIRTDEYVATIADLARKTRTKAPRVTARLPVIFAAREMPNLLQAIELGVNGRRLVKGDSPLIGREGERLLGSVTLIDDPCLKGAPGSRPYDHEGSPSRRTALFGDGVFRSFLFDRDTAARAGRETTASAFRDGISSPPSVGVSNLVMSPGESGIGEMIAGLREGIVVYGVLGGGQSNLLAGDFALNVMLGFLVRDGEVRGRLVDTMVAGNVYEAFGAVAASGVELKPSGNIFAPDVMFEGLSVTGR